MNPTNARQTRTNDAIVEHLDRIAPDADLSHGVRYYVSLGRHCELQAHVSAPVPKATEYTSPDKAAELYALELVRQLRDAADRIESRLETVRFA